MKIFFSYDYMSKVILFYITFLLLDAFCDAFTVVNFLHFWLSFKFYLVFDLHFFLFCFLLSLKVVLPNPESTSQPSPSCTMQASEAPDEANVNKSVPGDSAAQVEPLLADALVHKYDKESSNICDVKIGDGMDITIHGENGSFRININERTN
jgi:hypothetical protein